MRNITQEEVDAIQKLGVSIPEKVMFEVVCFGGDKRRYHEVSSDNAHFFLEEGQFLAESADGKTVSVVHVNNILAPEKKPQPEQKKRKKYIRPTGTGYLEKIPFDFSKLEVGDKVQLRNGAVETVHIIDNYDDSFRTYNNGGRYAGYWYYKNGKLHGFDRQENDEDILYILKKFKKPTPKKDKWEDEFILLERSTGKEVVFTRKELQIVKELLGKIADRYDTPDYTDKSGLSDISHAIRKLEDMGFRDCYTFVNNITLRPDTKDLIFKENI